MKQRQSALSWYIRISCSMMPLSFSTEASERWRFPTKPRRVPRLAEKCSVQDMKKQVLRKEVTAFAVAPRREKVSKTSPRSCSKSLCSRKCATPAGTSTMRPDPRSRNRVSTEPKFAASNANLRWKPGFRCTSTGSPQSSWNRWTSSSSTVSRRTRARIVPRPPLISSRP